MQNLPIIILHELKVLLRTQRALGVSIIYLSLAVLGGLLYVYAVASIEKNGLLLMQSQGMSPEQAAQSLDLMGEEAYGQILAFLAEANVAELAPSLLRSPILPAFLWATLFFLPALIVLAGYDQISGELAGRSLCYRSLRTSRATLLLGKVAAQFILFVVLLSVSAATLVFTAAAKLETLNIADTLLGLLRLWGLLLPVGACYIAFTALGSSVSARGENALVFIVGLLFGLRLLHVTRHFSTDGPFAIFYPLHWLSPRGYEYGLWLDGPTAPMMSAAAYLGLAALALTAAYALLRKHNL